MLDGSEAPSTPNCIPLENRSLEHLGSLPLRSLRIKIYQRRGVSCRLKSIKYRAVRPRLSGWRSQLMPRFPGVLSNDPNLDHRHFYRPHLCHSLNSRFIQPRPSFLCALKRLRAVGRRLALERRDATNPHPKCATPTFLSRDPFWVRDPDLETEDIRYCMASVSIYGHFKNYGHEGFHRNLGFEFYGDCFLRHLRKHLRNHSACSREYIPQVSFKLPMNYRILTTGRLSTLAP